MDKIELKASDLIPRPPDGKSLLKPDSSGQSPQALLKTVKDSIDQVKEIVKLIQDMGINIPGLSKLSKDSVEISKKSPNQNQQFQAFLNILIVKYGDITVNELLEKLKADLGTKRISKIGQL